LVTLVFLGGVARADDEVHCRAIAGGTRALENIDARVRLSYLRTNLAHGAFRAKVWSLTWAGIYTALTAGELGLALTTSNPSDQLNNGIGAGSAFIGVLVIAVAPLDIMHDQHKLEKRLRLAPPDEDPCAQLADAERVLLRGAKSEAFGKSVLVHAGSFVFNAGLGILLGAGFGHWNAAAQTALIGIAVGEIQINTQPVDVVHTLENYRRGRLATNTPPRFTWAVTPDAGPNHVALRLAMTW
jgi:hypothetical protein